MHGPKVVIILGEFLPDGLVSIIWDGLDESVIGALELTMEIPKLVWTFAMAVSLFTQLWTMTVKLRCLYLWEVDLVVIGALIILNFTYFLLDFILTFVAMVSALTSASIIDFVGRKGAMRVYTTFCVGNNFESAGVSSTFGTITYAILQFVVTGIGVSLFDIVDKKPLLLDSTRGRNIITDRSMENVHPSIQRRPNSAIVLLADFIPSPIVKWLIFISTIFSLILLHHLSKILDRIFFKEMVN